MITFEKNDTYLIKITVVYVPISNFELEGVSLHLDEYNVSQAKSPKNDKIKTIVINLMCWLVN